MTEMFGVASLDIDGEVRATSKKIVIAKQMVNGPKMRQLIASMVTNFGAALRNGRIQDFPNLSGQYNANKARLMGLVFGAISDFCFNMEYVRRVTDSRWSYCTKTGTSRVYYPYLGVCPHCIGNSTKPLQAALGVTSGMSDAEQESRARYFGNKVESHHVGRIGERVLVYILDMLTKSKFKEASTLMVFDDQHDVDAVFFFDEIGILAQIKASPLVLLPVMSELHAPLTEGVDEQTGLPKVKPDHTFTGFAAAEHQLNLYLSLDDSILPIGPRDGTDWPYEPMLGQLDETAVLRVLENWIAIYLSFEIPKQQRVGQDKKRAHLTAGWGAPIDDNKTKAGLARSDNMMKGTYASLKYGAYYVQECQRKTLRTVLVGNIDPVHQYAEYLEKLEDVRWGHKASFTETSPDGDKPCYSIHQEELTYLFDGVFTFNRQIMNDPIVANAWNLDDFIDGLSTGKLDEFLIGWGEYVHE